MHVCLNVRGFFFHDSVDLIKELHSYILCMSLILMFFSTDVEFNVTYPRDWFDSNNWCETDSETGDCKTIARLDSEKVPCINDDVVYPSGNSFYVNLETGIDIKVNTFKITGKVCFWNVFR